MSILTRSKLNKTFIPFCKEIRKDIYRDTGRYGLFSFGAYEFGAENEIGRDIDGVYQMRHGVKGPIAVKMRFALTREKYPYPDRVVLWDKMRAGVAAWKNLTTPEKEVYNIRAKGKRLTGYNLFIKEYMLS